MSHKRGQCVHFNGMQNKTCDAGVDYDEAFGKDRSCRGPCIQEYKTHERIDGKMQPVWKQWWRPEQRVIPCEKFRLPTAEEIAACEADVLKALDRMRLVMTAVKPWRSWSTKNSVAKQEVIECPACKGRLHLSQAAYNGHVCGECETEGCVSWME